MSGDAGEAMPAIDAPPPKRVHKKRKASKGRLKKLWRRATTPPGIASRSEWVELMELHSEWKLHKDESGGGGGAANEREAMNGPLPGPSVLLSTQKRKFTDLDDWQMTEGSDHRDILLNLLFEDGGADTCNSAEHRNKKKRKLNSLHAAEAENGASSSLVHVPPLPSWAHISNLGSVGGVAVIEVDVGGEMDAACPLMPSQRIKDAMNDSSAQNVWSMLQPSGSDGANGSVKRSIGAACKVKLFQGNKQPRCISDMLMFLPPPPSDSGTKQQTGCADLFAAMNGLLLKPKQLRSEGYPMLGEAPATELPDSAAAAREEICNISASPQSTAVATEKEALELVRALSVKAVMGDDPPDSGDDADETDEFTEMEHFVKTFSHTQPAVESEPRRQPKIFALDGEFVRTSAGPELARVSVIVYSGEKGGEKSTVVLDQLVKPRRQVLNYLTEFSGITAKMLEDVDTRLESVQLKLLALIDENDILVGHSLENDLRALRLVHIKVIDTSVVFRGNNGRKISLRHLANVLLQRKIQQGCGSTGHCSTEDAEAALVLALRRARRGDSFRLKENSRRQSILGAFQKVNRASNGQSAEANSSFAERTDGSCVCIGPNAWVTRYAQSTHGSQHVLSCESVTNSMSMAIPSWLASEKASKRAGFLWAHLVCEGNAGAGKSPWKDETKKIDEILNALVDRVPYPIPILVIFQQNYKQALDLTQQRKAARNPKATCSWTSLQEEEWERYVEQCRYAEAIWIGCGC